MSDEIKMLECPKCGGNMQKTYTREKVDELAPNTGEYRLMLLREFICNDCGFNKSLSAKEIIEAYLRKNGFDETLERWLREAGLGGKTIASLKAAFGKVFKK